MDIMKKSIFFWLYFISSITLAVYFATRIITSIMGRGPVSLVKNVLIMTDSANTDIESIKIAAGIDRQTNIKTVDLNHISNRVTSVPGIKNASTRLLSNGDIVIKTESHKVAAQYSDGLYYYPLSMDGTKIETPSTERYTNTIVFQGEIPDNLIDIINSASAISEYIDYIYMVESRRLNIYTKNGTTIYLPEDNPVIAINRINILNQTHKLLSRKLDVIDMRDTARILVKEMK